MTNTELKTQIDTQITNEIIDFAITPQKVGNNLKAAVDYTDQQTDLKVDKVIGKSLISDAEITRLAGVANVDVSDKENISNKSTNVVTDGESDTKYPSTKAVKTYTDGLVAGLLDDRGNYDASVNTFPASGGSGVAGAIMKGDLWYISVAGTLGGNAASVGASVRALVDSPDQTSANWNILSVGIGYTPENSANKSTNITTDAASDIKYPSVKAVKTYIDANSGGTALPYKSYVSLLSFQAGTFSEKILQNDIGANISWSNPVNGILEGLNFVGSGFKFDKTFIQNNIFIDSITNESYFAVGQPPPSQPAEAQIRIVLTKHDNTNLNQSGFSFTDQPVEIRVYN